MENEFLTEPEFCGLPVLAFESIETHFPPQDFRAFVALSSTFLNRARSRLYEATKEKGYDFISYISSRAFVWHTVEIGENCFILEDNVLQHGVKIGNNTTLWSGNHIGHRTSIGSHAFITSHAVISGFCTIGDYCFIGVNSCFSDEVSVAKDSVIGMGGVVVKSIRPQLGWKTEPVPTGNDLP